MTFDVVVPAEPTWLKIISNRTTFFWNPSKQITFYHNVQTKETTFDSHEGEEFAHEQFV